MYHEVADQMCGAWSWDMYIPCLVHSPCLYLSLQVTLSPPVTPISLHSLTLRRKRDSVPPMLLEYAMRPPCCAAAAAVSALVLDRQKSLPLPRLLMMEISEFSVKIALALIARHEPRTNQPSPDVACWS